MADLVGRTFGRWLVKRPLSHGGRGTLYEAQATDFDGLRAALRFIEAPDQAEISRSEVEYELLRTRPSNVVRVYDFGVAGVGPSRLAHLAMELSDEASLAVRLQQGALPTRDGVSVAGHVATALVAVHRAGVAHLDIKPANILVRGDSAKLVGFGAAQRVGALDPGSWKRSPAYLAPEQLQPAVPVTCASDIHALGVTLFELLTGTPVLDPGLPGDPGDAAPPASRARNAVLLALGRHDVPLELAQLVAQMLSSDPAQRPVAADVAASLRTQSANLRGPVGPDLGPVPIPNFPGLLPTTGVPLPGGIPEPRASEPHPAARGPGPFERLFKWMFPARSSPAPQPMPHPVEAGSKPPDAPRGGTSKTVMGKGGSIGTPISFSPDDEGDSATRESAMSTQADNAGVLFWNLGFPEDRAVFASRMMITGTPYALETALQPARAAYSLSQARVDAKDILGDGAEAPVKFVIEARGALVRAPGAPDWRASVASEGLICRAAGTDVFRVDVQADAAGPVSITVAFHVRGAITLRETISLRAVGIPGASPEVDAPAAPEPDAIEISAAAIGQIPEATLVLRLEPSERWYGLKIAAGGVEDSAILHTSATTAELAKEAVLARKKLVALSRRYRAEPAGDGDPFAGLRPADHGDALLEIARIGRRLHALLFGEPEENVPLDLTRVADLIKGHGQDAAAAPRMQIDAETLPFPWGIVYDAVGPLDGVAEVALQGFWGRRFVIDRTISAILRSLPPPTLTGAIQPCLNPHLDSEESLQVVASQRGFFERIGRTSVVRRAIESGEQLRAYLVDEGVGAPAILYFFCHARAAHEMNDQLFQIAAAADEQASLMLDPSGSQAELSVGELKKLRRSPLKARPLVFLNACSSAEADQYYQSQFLTLFVSQWQARAFIGSDWKIPTEFADAFARRALDRFLGRDPKTPKLALGAALHATAAEVLELKNPFPLIYALYGRPELHAA